MALFEIPIIEVYACYLIELGMIRRVPNNLSKTEVAAYPYRNQIFPLTGAVNVPVRMSTPICLHLGRCQHVPAHLGADTSKCWHVLSPVIPIIWTLFSCLDIMPCSWEDAYTLKCAHVFQHMPTHLGAGTCRHMDLIGMLGCVGTCQHLERYHRCWHLDVSAPSQVSAPLQVLTHLNTSQHPNKAHMIGITGVGS